MTDVSTGSPETGSSFGVAAYTPVITRAVPTVIDTLEFDIDRSERGLDPRTTLMLKNTPPGWTVQHAVWKLSLYAHGCFDYIEMPIDLRTGEYSVSSGRLAFIS
jgi:hypothetical protein